MENQFQPPDLGDIACEAGKVVIGFRHFEDVDAIRTYGLDGPLMQGDCNEKLARKTADTIVAIAEQQRAHCLRLIYSPALRRLRESVSLLSEAISTRLVVVLEENDDLRPFDQGRIRLPLSYTDGDALPILLEAWDAYCEATYVERDIHYRFGDPKTGESVRESLVGQFESLGESETEYLVRKYRLLLRLLSQQSEDELVVFCSQTNPLLFFREIFEIERDAIDPPPEELHFHCWRYFIDAIAERSRRRAFPLRRQDNLINELARHDLEFGETLHFDLSKFDIPKWQGILMKAQAHLLESRESHSMPVARSA